MDEDSRPGTFAEEATAKVQRKLMRKNVPITGVLLLASTTEATMLQLLP